MRKVIGISLIVVGVLLGLYVGLWVMFIGGAMSILTAIELGTITSTLVGIGILKMALASFVGYIIFAICYFIGVLILNIK